jgi:hypothetical protein
MFKIGQKVVFVTDIDCPKPNPRIDSICIIEEIDHDGWIAVRGFFEYSYAPMHFRPLDETFAEELLKRIEEEMKELLINKTLINELKKQRI